MIDALLDLTYPHARCEFIPPRGRFAQLPARTLRATLENLSKDLDAFVVSEREDLTPAEAAKMLGMSRTHLHKILDSGSPHPTSSPIAHAHTHCRSSMPKPSLILTTLRTSLSTSSTEPFDASQVRDHHEQRPGRHGNPYSPTPASGTKKSKCPWYRPESN